MNSNKLQKDYYEQLMGSDWPEYNDYLNDTFITNQSIKQEIEDLEKIRGVGKNFNDDEIYKLTKSKVFCMLPWLHLSSNPDGSTLPCCYADYKYPVGNARINTFKEIWNQEPYKLIRKNMLQDKPCKECTTCYEAEKNGFFSKREQSNKWFGHHIKEVNDTNNDGSTNNFKIRYLDIRFSNLCNFRCRTCGPGFSSNWYHDYIKLYNKIPKSKTRPDEDLPMINFSIDDEDLLFDQIETHIPYLEEIYFAGGEPLIMKEHYRLLEKLIKCNKKNIRLVYNTNFSELHYKDKHVFDYWKEFSNIRVGASLDASGKKAEYIRKGTEWTQVLENRRLMLKETPHVEFWVTSTISAMNVLHILDFHKQIVEEHLIPEPGKMTWNICLWPEYYRPNIFNKDFKNKVIIPQYEKHIEWLAPLDSHGECTDRFVSLLNFIKTDSDATLYKRFLNEVNKLDEIRDENFWKVFPEFNSLNNNGL